MRAQFARHTLPLLLTLAALFASAETSAQTVEHFTLSGFIRDASTGETLPGAHVQILNSTLGTASNNYGHYALVLPKGERRIRFSYVGYKPLELEILLERDSTLHVELEASVEIGEVVVEGQASHQSSRSARLGTIMVPKRAITEVPMLLGERDALRVIQLLPGVQKGREGTSGLYVRGGGPDQNLIILDDAPVYNAHHLLGMFSLFNGSAIKSMELQKGGFPARYGGRLASVLDIVMEDGNMREYHGSAGIGLVASHAMVQGPIAKEKASFIVTGRRTYIDLLLKPFVKASSSDMQSLNAYFYDLTAKLNWRINDKHRIYLSGYFGRDKFSSKFSEHNDSESKGGLWWGNATGTLRWNYVIRPNLFSNVSALYSMYRFNTYHKIKEQRNDFELRYYSGIQNAGLRWDLQWTPHPSHTLRGGLHLLGYEFTPSSYLQRGSMAEEQKDLKTLFYSGEAALYVEDDMRLGNWGRANIGIRLSDYITRRKQWLSIEPRISAAFYITPEFSAKTSFAMMEQYLHLLTGSGLGMPTDLWVPATLKLPPQKSWIASAGFVYDIPAWSSTASIEGYYKQNRGIIHYQEGASFFSANELLEQGGQYWEDKVTRGKSWSGGVEFLFQRHIGNLTGWIGYTLSWTQMQFDELNEGRPFWASYDRRHDVSIVLMYRLNDNWRFSGTWIYGTGNAFDLPLSTYAGADIPSETHNYREKLTQYGQKNSYRMAPYHRLDLGIQWSKKRRYYERIWSLDIYNAYCRMNPFFYYVDSYREYDETTNESTQRTKLMQISLFPIVPTISLIINF